MNHKDVKVGSNVVYVEERGGVFNVTIPIPRENIGVVTSKNDKFVFVKYGTSETSQATKAENLIELNLD